MACGETSMFLIQTLSLCEAVRLVNQEVEAVEILR